MSRVAPSARPAAYLAVLLGAAAGGLLRTLLSLSLPGAGASAWPWPTLLINLLGSALIGAFWARVGPGGTTPVSLERRLLVMTGFCGGFTTFSAFGVEALALWTAGMPASALAYVCATGLGGPLLAWGSWSIVFKASGRGPDRAGNGDDS